MISTIVSLKTVSGNTAVHDIPSTAPNITATPPRIGIGSFCNFLASGLSTIIFMAAMRTNLGCTQPTASNATTSGTIINRDGFVINYKF